MASTSKAQIDQLGERLRKGETSDEDVRLLEDYRLSFAESYEEVVATIQRAVQLDPTGRRAKLTKSIIAKLRRKKLGQVRCRTSPAAGGVVRDVLAQEQVVERLRGELAGAKIIDRRKQPSHGYRAVHIMATARNKLIEIQVRTELQHLWAQLSEKLADAGGPAIKYGGGDPEAQKVLSTLSLAVQNSEDLESDPNTTRLASIMKPLVGKLGEGAEVVLGTRRGK